MSNAHQLSWESFLTQIPIADQSKLNETVGACVIFTDFIFDSFPLIFTAKLIAILFTRYWILHLKIDQLIAIYFGSHCALYVLNATYFKILEQASLSPSLLQETNNSQLDSLPHGAGGKEAADNRGLTGLPSS